MKFGKLPDIQGIDFLLPPDPPRTTRVLAEKPLESSKSAKIFLGATGWGNKEWVGKWYPPKTPARDFLKHYSRQFNTIEFNSTHYRIPDNVTVARWFELSREDFRFCPKVPQQISHRARLQALDPTRRFAEAIRGLGMKLGPTFLQLPDYHKVSEANLIHHFIQDWPDDLPLTWEFRHPDWFSDPAAEPTFDFMEQRRHGTVITDVAGRRDVLHMELTTPVLVLRFVGNGGHPTDYSRTDDWIARIHSWIQQGLHEAYLFIHQPEMALVPEFTAYWANGLRKATGLDVLVPTPVAGTQQSLF